MHFDSLIFDMDGTLWDNVSSYVRAWNIGFEKIGHAQRVVYDDLIGLMGKQIDAMMDALIPESTEETRNALMHAVFHAYREMDDITPVIFPDVLEGLEKLSKKYKLLLLSNCEEGGLVKFMKHTGTTHLFTDYAEHGQNFMPKSHNLKLLIERNNLQSTIYIGDTDGDSHETRKAGIPFGFVTYGFGKTSDYDVKFDSFKELTDYFTKTI
ncbi:MAG: HAD family hydrolase [Bacteroidales bacterium]|nr:HAD family hydrolase [Bacteroidales bacterium]